MLKNSAINECDIFKLATTTTAATAKATTTTVSEMSSYKSNDEATRRAHDQKKNQFQLQTAAAAAAAAVTKATRRCCILNAGQLIKQLILLITSVVLTMFFNNNNNNTTNNNKKLYMRTLRTRSRSRTKKRTQSCSNNKNDNRECSVEEHQRKHSRASSYSYSYNNNSNNNNCEHDRDEKKQRLCCRCTVFIKMFVLIIMMIMILATTRVVVVHGQQIIETQRSVDVSEVSEKHYNKSNKINVDKIGSNGDSLSSEEEEIISTRLGVDLIKSNNMFSTAEVVVKEENDQEAQQQQQKQQKIQQEVKSSAKLNKHTHTHTRARTRTRARTGTATGIGTGTGITDRDTNSDSFAVADDNVEAEHEHENEDAAEAEAEHEHEDKVEVDDDDVPPPPPPPATSGKVKDSPLIASIPTARAGVGAGASSFSSSSAARNIINLMSRDNVVLKRQLREKAKHDSLESIKMHILMRLKLTKLPNITSPIPVPQSILENFYKAYNATRSNSTWRRGSHKSPNLSHHNHMKTQHPYDRSSGTDAANDNTDYDKEQLQSDDAYAYANSQSDGFIGDEDNNDEDSYDNERQFYSSMRSYGNENYDDDDDDSIMSHINSIYIFPEIIRVRHNRRADLLHFKLDSNADVSRATMHLYIRGIDWIREHEPSLVSDVAGRQVVVAIHKAVRRPNATNYTHKLKVLESRHEVPSGVGQWVKINVLSLFTNWIERRNESHEILINGIEPWMRALIVTTDSTAKAGPLTVHIEIGARTKHRYKRSTSLDCQESDHEDRCCRYPLKVNFRTFGWNFVIAPTSFDAYFCNGECKVGYLEHYTHTHLTSLTASATPCCSPTKMSPLNLLYFDDNNQLVMSVIPNMSVEKCSCS